MGRVEHQKKVQRFAKISWGNTNLNIEKSDIKFYLAFSAQAVRAEGI